MSDEITAEDMAYGDAELDVAQLLYEAYRSWTRLSLKQRDPYHEHGDGLAMERYIADWLTEQGYTVQRVTARSSP